MKYYQQSRDVSKCREGCVQVIHNCYAVSHVGLEHPRSLVLLGGEWLEAGTSCLQILKDDCNEHCLLFLSL